MTSRMWPWIPETDDIEIGGEKRWRRWEFINGRNVNKGEATTRKSSQRVLRGGGETMWEIDGMNAKKGRDDVKLHEKSWNFSMLFLLESSFCPKSTQLGRGEVYFS